MARPSILPMDVTQSGWLDVLNTNFSTILDTPFPIYLAADLTALNLKNPKLYTNCLALLLTENKLYVSDGVSWNLYDVQLDFVPNLLTSAPLSELISAINDLMVDMRAKGLMASS